MTTITIEKIQELRELARELGAVEFKSEIGGESFYVWDSEGKSVCKTVKVGKWDEPRTVANFIAAANPATILALLDLAQRAMLPQPQGQALPELPEGRSAIALCDEYGSAVTAFTADDMHAYARAYASQLALPAGPVPEVQALANAKSALYAIAKTLDDDELREYAQQAYDAIGASIAAPAVAQHSDDIAVDRFAAAMKEKLKLAREKGRGGWEQCSQDALSRMLREHVEKGDPRDVANFCMMLWNNGAGIAAVSPAVAQPDNTAAWESGELGRSAEHAKAAPAEIERQVAAAVAQPVADELEQMQVDGDSELLSAPDLWSQIYLGARLRQWDHEAACGAATEFIKEHDDNAACRTLDGLVFCLNEALRKD